MTRNPRRADDARRPHGGRRPDPLGEALANMSHIGRVWFVARRPGLGKAPSPKAMAHRHQRNLARDFAREPLDATRAQARDAGFRRLSRWDRAGAPVLLLHGRTPLPATRPAPAPRTPLARYPWDLPETMAQTERIRAQQGGGRARAAALAGRHVPRVTVVPIAPEDGVKPQGARSRRRAARRAARSGS